MHISKDGMVNCRAYVAAQTPFQPIRKQIGSAGVVTLDSANSKDRNNVRCYSAGSFVKPEFRRDGVLNAMYDHLDNHGFVVYPADGTVGEKFAQAQSDDAVAFWKKRKARTSETKLVPATDAELWGWNDPMKTPTEMLGMPVREQIRINGYAEPMLLLWEKTYAKYLVQIGAIFLPDRGFRIIGRIKGAGDYDCWDSIAFVDSDNRVVFSSYDTAFDRRLPSGARTVLEKIAREMDKASN